ncbi:hypothetical protein L6452_19632 [Arctium lappa]|uniref:Uncharacterized protein n=1 Tax=Arctium lappa TaxID=4217 RepID=A0ACB9BA11_ARCLA|nr:hypothetical protein L6452_19632 [Arctium lappa]
MNPTVKMWVARLQSNLKVKKSRSIGGDSPELERENDPVNAKERMLGFFGQIRDDELGEEIETVTKMPIYDEFGEGNKQQWRFRKENKTNSEAVDERNQYSMKKIKRAAFDERNRSLIEGEKP